MGRHPLVQVDQLVDLVAGESPAPLHEVLEAVPRRAVSEHERVDIHVKNPTCAT
jgi:hypothetical protein